MLTRKKSSMPLNRGSRRRSGQESVPRCKDCLSLFQSFFLRDPVRRLFYSWACSLPLSSCSLIRSSFVQDFRHLYFAQTLLSQYFGLLQPPQIFVSVVTLFIILLPSRAEVLSYTNRTLLHYARRLVRWSWEEEIIAFKVRLHLYLSPKFYSISLTRYYRSPGCPSIAVGFSSSWLHTTHIPLSSRDSQLFNPV